MDNFELTKHYVMVLMNGADIIVGPLSLIDISKYLPNRRGYQVHCLRYGHMKESSQIFDSPEKATREFLKLKDKISKKKS